MCLSFSVLKLSRVKNAVLFVYIYLVFCPSELLKPPPARWLDDYPLLGAGNQWMTHPPGFDLLIVQGGFKPLDTRQATEDTLKDINFKCVYLLKPVFLGYKVNKHDTGG